MCGLHSGTASWESSSARARTMHQQNNPAQTACSVFSLETHPRRTNHAHVELLSRSVLHHSNRTVTCSAAFGDPCLGEKVASPTAVRKRLRMHELRHLCRQLLHCLNACQRTRPKRCPLHLLGRFDPRCNPLCTKAVEESNRCSEGGHTGLLTSFKNDFQISLQHPPYWQPAPHPWRSRPVEGGETQVRFSSNSCFCSIVPEDLEVVGRLADCSPARGHC